MRGLCSWYCKDSREMVCLIEFYYGVIDDGYAFGGAGAVEDEVGGVVVHYISHGVVGG